MKTISRTAAALGATLALAGLAACDRGNDATPPAAPHAIEQTINVKPAPPTGDPPGTTPVAGDQSDLTRQQSQSKMPLEGQNHNYSTVAPEQSQKPREGSAPTEGDNAQPDPQQHKNQQPDIQRSR